MSWIDPTVIPSGFGGRENLDDRSIPGRNINPNPQTSTASNGGRPIVPAACIACRTKHLKCDGVNPCSRCSIQGLACSFVRSRRGYKGPRRVPKVVPGTSQPRSKYVAPKGSLLEFDYYTPTGQPNTSSEPSVTGSSPKGGDHSTKSGTPENLCTPSYSNTELIVPGVPTQSSLISIRDRCLEAFFYYAHPAHPFLLPKAYLLAMLKTQPMPHLEAAMRYLGSHYVESAPKLQLAEEAMQLLSNPLLQRDGFTVQANLLVAIALDGNTELKRAQIFMTQAEDIALEIGMHQREYAVLHGGSSPIMEESWRRTWWELFVVDGMIAGVHQQSSFRLNEIAANVLLPCEEQDYITGRIPYSRSVEDFDDIDFSGDAISFSSFAYRIAAVRNLGKILQLQQVVFADDPVIAKVDAYLVNWSLNLPALKKIGILDGQVDEMLFQAQMITNASTIVLHRPHSQLDTSVVRNVTSCAPHRPVAGGQMYNVHAAKIIQAAENISKLITLPVPLIKHTHFFTCVITLASIVHLSCWASLLPLSQDENLKQQIRLNTGALNTISDVWPSAHKVQEQVRGVAQEVFTSRKAAAEEGFWNTFSDDEVMRSMIEDESIINGFQLI